IEQESGLFTLHVLTPSVETPLIPAAGAGAPGLAGTLPCLTAHSVLKLIARRTILRFHVGSKFPAFRLAICSTPRRVVVPALRGATRTAVRDSFWCESLGQTRPGMIVWHASLANCRRCSGRSLVSRLERYFREIL